MNGKLGLHYILSFLARTTLAHFTNIVFIWYRIIQFTKNNKLYCYSRADL